MNRTTPVKNLLLTLRIATSMCFIGHGIFGIITKSIWCNYFAVFGIGQNMAYSLMPYLGTIDILLGLIFLVYPIRVIALWLVIWGLTTALLRPLSGEPLSEFIERAGNFGAPLAILLLSGGLKHPFGDLFKRIPSDLNLDVRTLSSVQLCLRFVVFLLLVGHGWLNIIEKKGLISQYISLGLHHPAGLASIIGSLEICAAFIILFKPAPHLIMAFLIWKITSELFYPHYELFEFIERGGSYGSLLALWLIVREVGYSNYNIIKVLNVY